MLYRPMMHTYVLRLLVLKRTSILTRIDWKEWVNSLGYLYSVE